MLKKLLISIIIFEVIFETRIENAVIDTKENIRKGTTFIIASDYRNSLAYAKDFYHFICEKSTQPLAIKCRTYYTFLENSIEPAEFDCRLELSVEQNLDQEKDIKLVSITTFGTADVIVKWIVTQNDVVLDAKYNTLNLFYCKGKNYSVPIGLKETDLSFANDFFLEDLFHVHVVASGGRACLGAELCSIDFNGKTNDPLTFKLNNAIVAGDSVSYTKTTYFVQGNDPKTGKYRAFFIDQFGKQIDIITLDSEVEFVSSRNEFGSGLALCYVENRSSSVTRVNCINSDKYVDIRLNKTAIVPEPVRLVSVFTMDRADRAILLISERINCIHGECWNLFITMVSENVDVETREVKFNCVGDRKKLTVHGFGSLEQWILLFACEGKNENNKRQSYLHLEKVHFGRE